MKKNLYPILITATAAFIVVILVFAKKPAEAAVPAFKERMGNIALSAEWINAKESMQGLLAAIESNPKDYKSKLALAQAYIQEARVTGDHAYYDKAALELLDDVIKNEPKNFEALCCKATVLLSQHHFSEGLKIAQAALPVNPNNAFIYGIMCDAYVELGNYPEAVNMADKMVSIRPDIRSYSRVSYLREIHGDLPGAIQAMKLAVSAGYPGLEQTEWARVTLGHLYENAGQPDSASFQYHVALQERPDYPFAVAGLGRIEAAKGNYRQAIIYLEKAKSLITEFSFADELTDVYALNNEKTKAERSANEVIEMLGPGDVDESESGHGHYADKELAYAYLKVNDHEKALKHALIEYERRPENIDVCETVAWVYYKQGNFAAANTYIDKALRTKSTNPTLLCHAGLIKIKAGRKEAGTALIKKALEPEPLIDQALKKEAAAYLAVL
jgi:tetratricopeptide (TPR) repeat protein